MIHHLTLFYSRDIRRHKAFKFHRKTYLKARNRENRFQGSLYPATVFRLTVLVQVTVSRKSTRFLGVGLCIYLSESNCKLCLCNRILGGKDTTSLCDDRIVYKSGRGTMVTMYFWLMMDKLSREKSIHIYVNVHTHIHILFK